MTANPDLSRNDDDQEDAHRRRTRRLQDFKNMASLRPSFGQTKKSIEVTQSPNPAWQLGDGARSTQPHGHREIAPYASGRTSTDNYRLLISGIAPRAIALISTMSLSTHTKNLSPFSYFGVMGHNPPLFGIGISPREGDTKDTYINLKETGECVINTVSEHMIEAVQAASVDAPYGVSEWQLAGFTEAPASTVKPSRVRESIFSIEAKVIYIKEFPNQTDSAISPTAFVLVEGTRFWVQDDALNEGENHIDLNKLRPIGQLGGTSYSAIKSTFELPRPLWNGAYEHGGNN